MARNLHAVLACVAVWSLEDRHDDIVDGLAIAIHNLAVMECSTLGVGNVTREHALSYGYGPVAAQTYNRYRPTCWRGDSGYGVVKQNLILSHHGNIMDLSV